MTFLPPRTRARLVPFVATVLGLFRLALVASSAAAASTDALTTSTTLNLTILFTNDLKGQLRPSSYFGETRGGMARMVRLLRALDPDGRALIVDGGDALGPDPMAHFDSGRLFSRLMGKAGYSALVPGNHGLNYGIDTLKTRQQDAGFPFIAANLVDSDSLQPALTPYVIIEKTGVRVLITGLLSTETKRIVNPATTGDIEVLDPETSLKKLLETQQRGRDFDYAVALTHMRPLEALKLAQSVPAMDLFIAGDNPTDDLKDSRINLVRLGGGTRVVSSPQLGAYLGRVDVRFSVSWRGGVRSLVVESFGAELIPVVENLPQDADVVRLIVAHEASYQSHGRQVVATINEEIVDSPQFISDLMRQTMGVEVGLINLGALRPRSLGGSVLVAQIDSLLRFDDRIVAVTVTGKQLLGMAGSSKQRTRPGQQLVFSGFDPATEKVGGIALQKQEEYTIATTRYLASGGDGYFERSSDSVATVHELELGQAVSRFLASHIEPLRSLEQSRSGGSSWKTRTQFTNSLSVASINSDASRYRGVSSISGRDAMAWNAVMNARTSRTTARGALALDVKSSFGQLREQDRFREATDRLDADLVYTLQKRQPAPFLAAAVTTVFTAPANEDRPMTLRGSAGVHTTRGKSLTARLGLGLERDFVAETNQVGLEVVPEYRRRFAGGNAMNSKAKLFMSATESRKVSLQQFNSLVINVSGDLHITVDANFFFHVDNQVNQPALKSELQIGLGYVWDGKWVR